MPQMFSWLSITKRKISRAISAPQALEYNSLTSYSTIKHYAAQESRSCKHPHSYQWNCRAVLISHGAVWAGSNLATVAHHQHCHTEGPTKGMMSMEKKRAAGARLSYRMSEGVLSFYANRKKNVCLHLWVYHVSRLAVYVASTFSWNKVHN